ncbi:MAG TPA: hypothetical protein VGD56_16910, partial [Gemmatirosa sp.]
MRHAARRWVGAVERYWFAPQPVADLALLRITLVSVLLIRLPSLATARTLGIDGPRLIGDALPVLRLAMVPLGKLGRWDVGTVGVLAWWIAVASGVLAVVGFASRVAVLVFAWSLVVLYGALYSRSGAIYHNNALALITLGLLACGPCGAAWSLDRWIARSRGRPPIVTSPDARWPLVTVQWLFAITYLSAACSKLSQGIAWFEPATIQFYLIEDGLLFRNPVALFAAQFPALAAASALFAVAYEGLFWVGLVWRRALPVLLLGGVVMHTGIYVLQRADFAEYAPLAIVFIDPVRRLALEWASSTRTTGNGNTWAVLYDGLCPRCRRTRDLVSRFDPGHRLTWVDFEGEPVPAAALAPGLGTASLR